MSQKLTFHEIELFTCIIFVVNYFVFVFPSDKVVLCISDLTNLKGLQISSSKVTDYGVIFLKGTYSLQFSHLLTHALARWRRQRVIVLSQSNSWPIRSHLIITPVRIGFKVFICGVWPFGTELPNVYLHYVL